MLPLLDNFIAANKASKSAKALAGGQAPPASWGGSCPPALGQAARLGGRGRERPPLLPEPTQALTPVPPQPSFSP